MPQPEINECLNTLLGLHAAKPVRRALEPLKLRPYCTL